MIIAEARKVLLFTPVNEQKTGQSGALFVTNFRLSFITSHEKHLEVNLFYKSLIIYIKYSSKYICFRKHYTKKICFWVSMMCVFPI